jgi:AraC-like DNA-binding protein
MNVKRIEELRFDFHGGGWATLPPGSTFGPRVLNDYEFLWMIEGTAVGSYDDKTFDLPPNSFVLARNGMMDYYRWDPLRQTRAAYIHFMMKRGTAVLPPEKDWPIVRYLPDGDIIRPLFRHVLWLFSQKKQQSPLAQNAMRQLIGAYVCGEFQTGGYGETELPQAVARVLKSVQTLWNKGPIETPSLKELARIGCVCEGHLCRLFQQSLGCGPMTALRMLRLDRASALLRESNLKVHEVAILTGFESQFHFSRCSKSAFRCSPRKYRDEVAAGRSVSGSLLASVKRFAGPTWD